VQEAKKNIPRGRKTFWGTKVSAISEQFNSFKVKAKSF